MNKKAQVLIISLWILAVLTMLAVSLGYRVPLALKLSGYQKDKTKALYLTKAGINREIVELEKDRNAYDALNEPWADNKEIFEKIFFGANQNEFASVSYMSRENEEEKTKFGVIDEERKININTAPKALLSELLKIKDIGSPESISNNICVWRGDAGGGLEIPDYAELGYSNKNNKFVNKEELILVQGIEQETYDKLSDLITVWGSGRVNINTASKETLEILVEYCVKQLEKNNIAERNPENLVDKIMDLRSKNIVFVSTADLESKLPDLASLPGPRNILNELDKVTVFKSSCFYIVSNGKIKSNPVYTIECVFAKDTGKIIYWHEN